MAHRMVTVSSVEFQRIRPTVSSVRRNQYGNAPTFLVENWWGLHLQE